MKFTPESLKKQVVIIKYSETSDKGHSERGQPPYKGQSESSHSYKITSKREDKGWVPNMSIIQLTMKEELAIISTSGYCQLWDLQIEEKG